MKIEIADNRLTPALAPRLVRLFGASCLAAMGCSANAEVDRVDTVDALGQSIWGGTEVEFTSGDYPAAVSLQSLDCSGALIAPDAIVTAAHCVATLPNGDKLTNGGNLTLKNAWVWMDGSRQVITGSGRAVRVRWDPHWQGGIDTASDFGIITLIDGPTFDSVIPDACSPSLREDKGKPSCYFRIHDDALATTRYFVSFGRGYNSYTGSGNNVMRFGGQYIDGWDSARNYFWSVQEAVRNCGGDSGGPAVGDKNALRTSFEMLLGTDSNGENSSSRTCTREGGRERFNRTAKKVWLIDEALSADRGRTCKRFSGTDYHGRSYNYRKCW